MRAKTIELRAVIAGLVVAALLGLAACGDDDDGSALGAGDPGDPAGESGGDGDDAPVPDDSPGAALGACDLLEKAEVEDAFGSSGAVADGETIPFGCEWQVGEPVEGAVITPKLTVQFAAHPDFPADTFPVDAEAQLDEVRALPDTIEVPGLGDEALLDFAVLYVVSGEVVIALAAFSIPEALTATEEVQDDLVALGEKVLSRL